MMTAAAKRALFVGADRQRFQELKAHFPEGMTVEFAIGPSVAVGILQNRGPYPLIVVDLAKPLEDSDLLVAKLAELAASSVRYLCVPPAQLEQASVLGSLHGYFRVLPSNTPPEVWQHALAGGVDYFVRHKSQEEVVREVVTSSVRVLLDVLAFVRPSVFRRSQRLAKLASHVATQVKLENAWQVELAAVLYRLGCITFPEDVTDAFLAGRDLSPAQKALVDTLPQVTNAMLAHISVLEPVSRLIEGAQRQFQPRARMELAGIPEEERLGAQIVRTSLLVDSAMTQGRRELEVVQELRGKPGYSPEVLDAFVAVEWVQDGWETHSLRSEQVGVGMVLAEDVYTQQGVLLVGKGEEITAAVKERLVTVARSVAGLREPFSVLVPIERVGNAAAEDDRF